jgi:hypothetical protein
LWGLWDAEPNYDRGAYAATFTPSFYIAQAEQAGESPSVAMQRGQDALAACRAVREHDDEISVAWVTDLGPSRCYPTLDLGFQQLGASILVETYLPENPNATPEAMSREARDRGYRYVVVCPGADHGYPLADYRDNHGVDGCCVWAAETLTQADWRCWI